MCSIFVDLAIMTLTFKILSSLYLGGCRKVILGRTVNVGGRE